MKLHDRMLRLSFFQNKKLAPLSIQAMMFFHGLVCCADDLGREIVDFDLMKGLLFPYKKDLDTAEIESWFNEIVKIGSIIDVDFDGNRYYQFVNWNEFQTLRHICQKDLCLPIDIDLTVCGNLRDFSEICGNFPQNSENPSTSTSSSSSSSTLSSSSLKQKEKEAVESNLSPSNSEKAQMPLAEKKTQPRGKQAGKMMPKKDDKTRPKDLLALVLWVFWRKREPEKRLQGISLAQCVWFYEHFEAQDWQKEGKSGKMQPVLNWRATLENWYNSGWLDKDECKNYKVPKFVTDHIDELLRDDKASEPEEQKPVIQEFPEPEPLDIIQSQSNNWPKREPEID